MLKSIRVARRGLKKSGGKIELKYEERLKRIPLMTRKNALMRELNDNIDYENVVVIQISLCLQVK